jgi:hypothetical protein
MIAALAARPTIAASFDEESEESIVIDLRQWASSHRLPDRPWLLLGKGPTFGRVREVRLDAFNVLGLNHVVREVPVDVAHAIDLDVVAACADQLRENCGWLVLPRRPHIDFRPAPRLLETFLDEIPILRELSDQGRLVYYNLSNSPAVDDAPVIKVRFFSAEAALNILAFAGARTIRSLGIDGGRGYSSSFQDLEQETMLANGRESFDVQFAEIDAIVNKQNLDYAPLNADADSSDAPMRVCVGADDSQLEAAAVLEHSIRKHASRPVEFNVMIDLDIPEPKDPTNRAKTGFSFYRFMIPELCGYEGRALYLDCDMQVFADLAQLWRIPFGENKVLCTYQPEPPEQWKNNPAFAPGRQMSVMMLDCSRLPWKIGEIIGGLDEGRYSYKQLMGDLAIVDDAEIGTSIPPEWNSLEHYEPGVTKLVHYTAVPTQPWKNDKNPLTWLWTDEFRETARDGNIDRERLEHAVREGYVKKSLQEKFDAARSSDTDRGERAVETAATGGRSWRQRLRGARRS